MANPYVDLCLVIQALRRNSERLRTPLIPATGIAASIYPHQLANALRVLADLRVRHLLADEVGLGKTVQALMILNALRSQRPQLKALIVVPDRLVPQWRDELLTRAHTAPLDREVEDPDAEELSSQSIRLAWEAQLRMVTVEGQAKWSLSDINPTKYDFLIVDELHWLRAELQDRIVRMAPSFEHLLLLTATPAFQHPGRHAQLFAMLEPERAAIARWDIVLDPQGISTGLLPNERLSSWPEWATTKLVSMFLEQEKREADACSGASELRETALAHCAYRRVIRTRRADYEGVLPRRKHHSVVTEPLDAEIQRQALMWRYFDQLRSSGSSIELVPLAKRVILSPPSIEPRVNELRLQGHDREGILERVKPLVHRSRGDSRLDALIDLLASIWRENPHERVLVAAQDNPTVDYLFDAVQARLPLVGPWKDRVQLVAARVRQGTAAQVVEDLGGFGNEISVNLEAFQRGEAQVLFATEAAQVGLNLQCARILVLYSVPWRPEEVEQWIGRLDRIGNATAFADAVAKTIDVYTIVQRGLVDEKVVAILKRFHVFERSVNLDGDHLEEVTNLIEAAALKPGSVSWQKLGEETEAMAGKDEIQDLDSALRRWLPWDLEWAKAVKKYFDDLPPFHPCLSNLPPHAMTGPRSWERALQGLVDLLERSAEYNIRTNKDPSGSKFRTLWYRFEPPGPFGQQEVHSRVLFSFGADPGHERSPRHAFAFITRRKDIQNPPQRSVTMDLDGQEVRRPLGFLNFGNPLHDELVCGWAAWVTELPEAINVALFDDHKFFASSDVGLYLLRVRVLDPGVALLKSGVKKRTLESMSVAVELTQEELLNQNQFSPHLSQLRCMLEADVRWLRSQLAAQFSVQALYLANGEWRIVDDEAITALVNPMAHERPGLPPSSAWRPSAIEAAQAAVGLQQLRSADDGVAKNSWSHLFPSFSHALDLRMRMVQEEAQNAKKLASLEVYDAERRLKRTQEHGIPVQVAQAKLRHAKTLVFLRLTDTLWAERLNWLDNLRFRVQEMTPRELITKLIWITKV